MFLLMIKKELYALKFGLKLKNVQVCSISALGQLFKNLYILTRPIPINACGT